MTVNHLANGSILHEGPAAEEFISGLCQEGKFIIPKVGDLYGIGGKPPADPPAQILVLSEPYGTDILTTATSFGPGWNLTVCTSTTSRLPPTACIGGSWIGTPGARNM